MVDEAGKDAPIGPPFSIVGVGDMDGSGKADIVFHNSQTGEIQIWFMDENRRLRRLSVVDEAGTDAPIGPPFSIVAAGDSKSEVKAVSPEVPNGTDPASITLRYKGINCFGETDEFSESDEIYLITIVTTIESGKVVVRTEKHPVGMNVYEEVDQGASFAGPIAPCYSGSLRDLSIAVLLREHDEGDPNAFRDKVDGVVQAGAAALALVSGVMLPVVAEELIVDAVNALIGSEDDLIAQVSRTFTGRELVLEMQKPPVRERDVAFTFFTDHRGEGATYKVYFDVVET